MKKIALLLVIAMLLTAVSLIFASCKFEIVTDRVTIQAEGNLKVGVISDTQLPTKKANDDGKYKASLVKALTVLKNNEVDLILFAGDIGDGSTDYAYELCTSAFDEVYGDNKPYVQYIMGNHDYWGGGSANQCRKRFAKHFNQSPWSVYTYGGVTFIGASPDSGSMSSAYGDIESWLKTEIETANTANPGQPIFVMTHSTIKGTVYGADDWGDESLDYLANYENVVSLSGHSHYSLLDENSIYQKGFTAINTQSISYTELEAGKSNGTIPPNQFATPMGYIMEISTDNVQIRRYEFNNGEELKADKRWILPIPLTAETFTYTPDRKDELPQMVAETGTSSIADKLTYLNFQAGTDDDFVHTYKVVLTPVNGGDAIERLYFTDFYNGLTTMAKDVSMPLYDVDKGTYNVKVYAIDQYKQVSLNYTQIDNVQVNSNVKYKAKW